MMATTNGSTNNNAGHSAEQVRRMQNAIEDLVSALELCLTCEGLTWEAEHDADIVIERVRRSGLAAASN